MSCTVTFRIHMSATQWGESVGIVGNTDTLSYWGKTNPTALIPSPYPFWTVTLPLKPNTSVEYKYVIVRDGKLIQWEELSSAMNRKLQTGNPGTFITIDDGSFGEDTKTIIMESQNVSDIESEFESNSSDAIEQDINDMNTESNSLNEVENTVHESTMTSEICPLISSLVDVDHNKITSIIEDENESLVSTPDTELEVDIGISFTKTSELESFSDETDVSTEQAEEDIGTDHSHHSWNSEYEKLEFSSEEIHGENDEKKVDETELCNDTDSDTWSCESAKVQSGENDEHEANSTTSTDSHVHSSAEHVEPVIMNLHCNEEICWEHEPVKGTAIVGTLLMVYASGMFLSAASHALNITW